LIQTVVYRLSRVGTAPKDLQNRRPVRPVRRGGEPQHELRPKVAERLLVRLGGRVMRFVDHEVQESRRREIVQVLRDTLN